MLAVPLFCMPAYLPVTAATVNYAPVVFVGFVAIAALWYAVWGRKNYNGPPTEQFNETGSSGSPSAAAIHVGDTKKD